MDRKAGAGHAGRVPVGTFHATCAGILRAHAKLVDRTSNFSIYDKSDSQRVLARTLTKSEEARINLESLRREILLNKNHDISWEEYDEYARDRKSRIVARAWRAYEEELRLADALDFDDLVLRSVEFAAQLQGHLRRLPRSLETRHCR